MALENLVIHDITTANFDLTKFEYHQIMFGATSSAVLNGTTVTVTGPITINLRIRSATTASGAAKVFAMGYRAIEEPLGLHFINGGFRE
tara:strand:+ start:834 stop:1100 length:267 start_codon:yes stop_codon:yes gene_type:complete